MRKDHSHDHAGNALTQWFLAIRQRIFPSAKEIFTAEIAEHAESQENAQSAQSECRDVRKQ